MYTGVASPLPNPAPGRGGDSKGENTGAGRVCPPSRSQRRALRAASARGPSADADLGLQCAFEKPRREEAVGGARLPGRPVSLVVVVVVVVGRKGLVATGPWVSGE